MIGRLSLAPVAFALPIGILALLVLMVMPIPTLLLDLFFVLNIALSVAILMVALNARKPLDFSSFPTVLLFATLLRLALNVASTRIVLINGHEGGSAAGEVIESFGAFLVGGNFAVGLFVFTILMIINLIVITKGAGRVSEVSARFVLDALPGKQMAIDADIAAGLVSSEDAKKRREEVSVEAEFYGSMDGASKFVKGDAIAALLILGVNVIAGFALGMISHDLSAGEAAERYITLAVGDALVAQVPALLLSIAAAAIVTRVADTRDLVGQISGQFSDPRGWLPVGLVLAALGAVPAMPQMIFLPAAAFAFWLWFSLRKREAIAATAVEEPEEKPAPETITIEDVSEQTLVTVELGYGLVHLVDEDKGSPLVARITGIRKQLSREFGFVLPQFRIKDVIDMPANAYRVQLGGVTLAQYEVQPNRMLAIDLGEANKQHRLLGEKTRDPSFGCPSLWIHKDERDHAVGEGFLTVDVSTVIATHINQLLLARGEALLGPEEVRDLLDAVKERAPGLVEAVYPDPLSLAGLTRVFRALIADGISLAYPQPILTSLALALQRTQDFNELIDQVRIDLGAQIVGRITPPDQSLKVATLDASLEGAILGSLTDPATGQPMIEPSCGQMIAERLSAVAEEAGGSIALIVQPPVRRPLAKLLKTRVPQCLVLSISELPASQPVEVLAVIGENAEGPANAELPSPADNPPLAA
ncbi:flagellar biosynthesis protein FlhA [Altererythrobacter lutimaris]|uniref:Flagellar biosynthesis protein FlhA n=1 Tax=Altererythrobacter lutimaris TaxID=2743979 RepID=A0A850HFL8_9SPHN|nr:flagellar biosynthesis protein FlhA [Altererythrobacter lutimaris]NVE93292.1 flagellar biosynthesis protein FlhA [Altererythrobacter lutimaris]